MWSDQSTFGERVALYDMPNRRGDNRANSSGDCINPDTHTDTPPQVLGPRWMENRKPLHLQNTLVMYNAIQVVFSAWLFYEVGTPRPCPHSHPQHPTFHIPAAASSRGIVDG